LSFARQLGFDAARLCSSLGIDATNLIRISREESLRLSYSGIGWNDSQYAAFQLACGAIAGLGFAVLFAGLSLFFELNLWLVFLCIPCAFFGVIAARMYVSGLAKERERDVEANLLDALRHFASALRSGDSLIKALWEVGRGGYGTVSSLVSEALVLVREGESVEAAFREVSEKTPSQAFKSFAASVAHASSTGADISRVVDRFAEELEASKRSRLAVYANECSRLSTITVVLTGVLPGMMVFILIEGSFVFGFRVPTELFLVSYLLVFPLAKYFLQARLALTSPGI
jgi:Flp pilus assembly protein TadB